MRISHSTPGGNPPCWFCVHFGGMVYQGTAARCVRDSLAVKATPAAGCVFWMREIGADDEPGPPPCVDGSDRSRPALKPLYAPPARAVAWAP